MNNDAAPRQLTFRAVVLAIVLAVILSAANAYLGLFAGLTIATAIPAAVISMGVLRLLGGGTILENNIVQTGASAGSSIAAGVIFTIPALVIMGYWPDFKYWWVLGIAGLGGLLGVLFSVPLRRSMIVEDPLPFPEGKAAAEVLKAGENPGPGLKILAVSAVIGAFVKLAAESGLRLIPDAWATSAYVGSSKITAFIGTNLSPALLGVGYIVGLNVGIVVVSGSILTWHIAIPLYQSFFMNTDPALAASIATASSTEAAFAIWGAKMRYLGVGAMLIGGVWTLISLRKSLLNGVKSGFAAARKSGGPALAHTERDLPMKWMLVALVVFTLPLLALYQAIVGQWHVSIPMTLIMIVAGFLFVSVSAYLAGLIGSSNNPVSGITISTILFASAVLVLLLGVREPAPGKTGRPGNPIRRDNLRRLDRTYWWVVALGAVFTLARFSEAFLVLRAQQAGIAVALVPLVMVAMNLVYAASAYPFGKLSDRLSHIHLLGAGLAVLIVSDVLLATARHWSMVIAGVAVWGIHMGMTQGLLSVMVASTAPPDLRGTAYGMFNLVSGIALLAASLIAGALWDAWGPSATFWAGGVFAALCLAGLPVIGRAMPGKTGPTP